MTAKHRGRPKVTSDDLQRSLIVETARQLFVRRGYELTTTDDIAAHCRISKQTLYRLFPGKIALFTAVIESHQQIWLDLPRPDDNLPMADSLLQIFRVDISEETDRERFDVIRLVIAETNRIPELSAILQSHGTGVARTALAGWLERQQQLGRIGRTDSLGLAQILLDMVYGAIIFKHTGDVSFSSGEDRRRHIQSCVNIFLNGVTVS